ncbi:MAG: HAD family phosphatase [Proteobacteria bacterium]|nr:HAD family phosphatase [Pseudomonadota bacterium]
MPAHDEAWRVLFDRHGHAFDETDFYRRTAGRTAADTIREYFGDMPAAELESRVREKEGVYRELFAPPRFREVPGFTVFVRAARDAGIAVGCATAGRADNIAFALENLGLEGFFDGVAGGHEVAHGKPAPDLFLLAARRMNVVPADCVVFEDAPLGIEGARRAGMLAVGLTTGVTAAELAGPHVVATMPDYRNVTPADIVALANARRTPARTGTD